MNASLQGPQKGFLKSGWIALRFAVFGVGGFVLMVLSTVEIDQWRIWTGREPYPPRFISPLISIPLAIVSLPMMLFGVGKWGQWGYMMVFLSFPASFVLLAALPDSWLPHDKLFGMIFLALVLGATATGVNALLRGYYVSRQLTPGPPASR
jgi:hypothetical protein